MNTISPNTTILESLPNVDVPYTSWLKDRTFGTLWLDNFAGNIFGPQPVSAQQTFLHPFRQEFSAWPDFWHGSSCPKRSAPVMTRNTASHGVHMLQDDATQRTVMCQQRGIRSARLKAEMIQLKGWSLKIELKESCARGFSHGFINP